MPAANPLLWSMLGEGGWLLGYGIDAADDCAGDAYYGGNAGILGDSRRGATPAYPCVQSSCQ
ncbi:hypothetical protein EV589_1096 [Mycobacterium sp. BK558]|nr:hypothetical protein EV589_1096 [Mycobacterium sp. BK558]